MYADHSPVANSPVRQVVVIEESDKPYTVLFVDKVLEECRSIHSTTHDGHDEIFWVVFGHEPKRLWDFTESALRSSLRRPKEERLPKEQLIAMGDDAPIGEILESFEYGNLHDYARRDMPRVCRELELETLGQLAKHTRSEIMGPQCRWAANKTLEYINSILREFGRKELEYFKPTPLSDDEKAFVAQHGLDKF